MIYTHVLSGICLQRVEPCWSAFFLFFFYIILVVAMTSLPLQLCQQGCSKSVESPQNFRNTT